MNQKLGWEKYIYEDISKVTVCSLQWIVKNLSESYIFGLHCFGLHRIAFIKLYFADIRNFSETQELNSLYKNWLSEQII